MADWPKIKAEYIRSEISVRALAKKYNVPYSTLRDRAGREKWKEKQVKKREITAQRMVDACATKEAKNACSIVDIANKLIEKLNRSIEDIQDTDYKRIDAAASILYRLKETKKGLNAADLREQEARIRKLEREASGGNEDSVIEIVMGGDAEEYSI